MITFMLVLISFVGLVITYFFGIVPHCQKKNLEHKRKLFNNWQEPPLPNKPDEGFNDTMVHIHSLHKGGF